MRGAGNRHIEADVKHEVLEHLPVFAAFDGFRIRANHLNTVFLQHAAAAEGHRGIERGLPAKRRQQNQFALRPELFHLRLLADDDFLDTLGRDGLDVGAVGKLRVGHDGGRIGVDEDDAVALLLEGFAGLGAGIIELACLADDDRSGADDEDAVNVSALGHSSNGGRLNTNQAQNERKLLAQFKTGAKGLHIWSAAVPAAAD